MRQRKLQDKKTKRLNVILPTNLYDAIATAAEEEQKSKGMLIEEIIRDWVNEESKKDIQKANQEKYVRDVVAQYFS